jgi:hypothetical protein
LTCNRGARVGERRGGGARSRPAARGPADADRRVHPPRGGGGVRVGGAGPARAAQPARPGLAAGRASPGGPAPPPADVAARGTARPAAARLARAAAARRRHHPARDTQHRCACEGVRDHAGVSPAHWVGGESRESPGCSVSCGGAESFSAECVRVAQWKDARG